MTDPLNELRALVLRHASSATPGLPDVTLWYSPCPTAPTPAIYEPNLYFPLQGTKRLSSGERTLKYGAGSFVLVSLDVPVVGKVIEASADQPYLAVSVDLDAAAIADLLLELPPTTADTTDAVRALMVTPATEPMYDALLRRVRLLDAPADAPLLAPMYERELLYRVLQSPRGAVLRQLARADSRLAQIQRAVKWIRAHLTESLPVETLAGMASMGVSSFHRHFKAVTGLSPLAFHKKMRLQEARRRLLTASPGAVSSVAFAVGYESASQFSREYARQFGISPGRDAARLRAD
jgi:AraC-like DNA-binding protein